ncbi:MAG: hypothetical protein ACRDTM_17485, partial [Micromonosporaceae bacterium]
MRINGLAAIAVVAAVLGTAGSATGSSRTQAGDCLSGPDFNGDRCGDLVVADPDATVAGKARAGRINVLYGGEAGAREVLTQGAGAGGTVEAGDRFGTIVRAVHVDTDGYADLVIATPAEDVGSEADAGIIQLVYGSADGLGHGRPGVSLRQGAYGIPGIPEAGDRFGAALAVNTTTG